MNLRSSESPNPHLIVSGAEQVWNDLWCHWIIMIQQGSTFPGAQGHIPLDFAVGP